MDNQKLKKEKILEEEQTMEALHENVMTKLDFILRKHNVDVEHYLTIADSRHAQAHTDILNMLAGELFDTAGKMHFMDYHRDKIMDLRDQLKTNPNDAQKKKLYEQYNIIRVYLNELYRHFYTFDKGEVVYANKHYFQLPSLEDKPDIEANMQYISKNTIFFNTAEREELCLIIMPDGTTYRAPYDHLSLAYWLNLSNVDLKSSLRFEASKPLYDFNITSLYNYKFSEGSDQDELIVLTHDQAQILGVLYMSLCHGWRYMKPLEYELKKSSGLGLGKKELFDEGGVAMQNLKRLSLYTGNYFNVKEYITEMRRGNSIHNPMK